MYKIFSAVFFLIILSLSAGEWKDIPYYEKGFPVQGNEKALRARCRLDLLTPDKKRDFPTLIWLHGGGLSRGGRYYPGNISRSKVAIAAVNYRLSGKDAACPDYIYDAAASVAWVLKNIKKYGGDPEKVYLAGHSAGAYLAAMVTLDTKYLNTFGCSPTALAGVFPISGQMSTHFRVLAERRAKDPRTPAFLVDEYAPLFHAARKMPRPRMLFLCGDPERDWPARVEENHLLAARLKYVCKDKQVRSVSIPMTTHDGCMSPALGIINREICAAGK